MTERGERTHGIEPDLPDKDVDPEKMELIDKIMEEQEKIYGFCLKKIRGRPNAESDARDIAQDVAYKAVSKISQLENPALLMPWLYRIAVNEISMYFRQNKGVENKMDEGADLESKESGKATTEERMIGEERKGKEKALVREALEQMPDSYSKPLVMFEFEGKSYKEIAEEMGLSVSAVKSRILRARRKVGEFLSGKGYKQIEDLDY